MQRIYDSDGVYVAKVMRDFINTWDKKPCEVLLEDFTKDPPSMMMQQLSGTAKKKTYVNGSYIASFPFAVYVRVNAIDTASKLDATGILNDLGKWFSEQKLPAIDDNMTANKIEMTALPTIAAKLGNGVEDYQAIFELEYYVRRN